MARRMPISVVRSLTVTIMIFEMCIRDSPCVIFGNEVHGPTDDFHVPVIGQGGYLVQDAADKQGTAIAPALSGINPVDGIGTALDVAFELSLIHIFPSQLFNRSKHF